MGLKQKRGENNAEVPATSEVKKPADYGKLPWTEEMDECLLKLVLHYGAHLPHLGEKKAPKNGAPSFHPKPSDRWRDLVRDFFSDCNGGQPYSERHYKLDKEGRPEYRKIKDHFETVCKDVFEDIQVGNQSGKEGDKSRKYQLVEQIMAEHDAAEAAKEGKKVEQEQLQEKLAKTTDDVLNGTTKNANKNTAVRVKMSDGTVVVDEERAAKKARLSSNSLDCKLLAFLDHMTTKTEDQRRIDACEVVLRQLQQYVLFNGHCVDAFLYQAYANTASGAPPSSLSQLIDDMGGLDMLISLYCNSDQNFSSDGFKNVMDEFGIEARHARIMHVHLNRWRKTAEQFAAARKDTAGKAKAGKASSSSGVSDLTGTDTNSPPQTRQATPPQQRMDERSQEGFTPEAIGGLLDNTHLD